MPIRRDEEHCTTAGHSWDVVGHQLLFDDKDAGARWTSDELVGADEDGVFPASELTT